VYDDEGKSLYGVMLHDDLTYEQVVMHHRFGLLTSVCAVGADDSDIEYLQAKYLLKDKMNELIGCYPHNVHFKSD
jgi:hypothetical protein